MSLESDSDALMELHALDRRAHLEGDAELLTSSMAEFVWEASRGGLNRLSRAELKARFAAYFGSVRYSVWDDLVRPHVSISGDGRQGWMAVHIEATVHAVGDEEPAQRSFESGWIATYEKHEGKWLMVGIASSVVDRA